jgi:hypothetical protein
MNHFGMRKRPGTDANWQESPVEPEEELLSLLIDIRARVKELRTNVDEETIRIENDLHGVIEPKGSREPDESGEPNESQIDDE